MTTATACRRRQSTAATGRGGAATALPLPA